MTHYIFAPISAILLGICLDAALGDPRWLPHPIRLFGSLIAWVEERFNTGNNRRQKGIYASLGLIILTGFCFGAANYFLAPYPLLFCLYNAIFLFYGICSRSLIDEALKVEKLLVRGDMAGARAQLAHIVGRETHDLSPTQIRAALLETLSENLSDGVVAPLFFFALGGVPGIMMYKMINTLDSMIGYKNDRYADFGRFAAQLDDVVNYIPARLTAFFMVAFPPHQNALRILLRDGKKHASPNAGYPEAALAGRLHCRLGGPNVYHGALVEKPFIGETARNLTHKDVMAACRINAKVAVLSYFLLIVLFWA